jgi:hypothetical protein
LIIFGVAAAGGILWMGRRTMVFMAVLAEAW